MSTSKIIKLKLYEKNKKINDNLKKLLSLILCYADEEPKKFTFDYSYW